MVTLRLDIKALIAIGGALVAVGIWCGVQQQRITALERHDTYYHGDLAK